MLTLIVEEFLRSTMVEDMRRGKVLFRRFLEKSSTTRKSGSGRLKWASLSLRSATEMTCRSASTIEFMGIFQSFSKENIMLFLFRLFPESAMWLKYRTESARGVEISHYSALNPDCSPTFCLQFLVGIRP